VASENSSVRVRPLTRRFLSGEPYLRLPEVERQIEEALRLEPRALMERLAEGDADSPRYLKEEALVYLIREHYAGSEPDLFEELSAVLTRRCQTHIKQYARRFVDLRVLDDCASEILSNAFEQILDFDTDRGDYIQVRFWHFLKRLEGEITKKYGRSQEKERMTDSLTAEGDDGDGPGLDKDRIARDQTLSPEQRLMLREGLLLLPEPIRTAFVLYHYDGWQIESSGAQELTIAKYFGKTPRTIRNWMARAEAILGNWRGK